ncbi:hypothetical protein Pint_07031 [Pistacia integerrima]|uniref:Uncharacterized protein n=1 Tax=Pistacia integerrima TaxID=434235 RepID=A0ACC0XT37_9ROSI|nr:hypothetical protein Pint_07031 [Pistacia integerrima]
MFAVGVYSSEKDLLEVFKRPVAISDLSKTQAPRPIKNVVILDNEKAVAGLVGATLVLTMVGVGPASAAELSLLASSLQPSEPSNALSLPTWVVHVSSVVEWITAMALVWQYGEKSEYGAWKGFSWGMVSSSQSLLVTLHSLYD